MVHPRARRWRVRSAAAVVTALLLSWPSVAWSTQGSRSFSGPTNQEQGGVKFRISMSVSSSKISDVLLSALTWKGPSICRATDALTTNFTKGSVAISGRRAKGRLKDSEGDVVTIKARVRAKSVKGTFVVTATGGAEGSSICTSGRVTFDASAPIAPPPDTQYSGSSGPGYPLSFEVSATGGDVENLTVAFNATCSAGAGDVAPTFKFPALPLSQGSFSGTVHTLSDTLSISGTFYGNTASGQIVDISHIPSLQSCTQSSTFLATAK